MLGLLGIAVFILLLVDHYLVVAGIGTGVGSMVLETSTLLQ